MSRSRADYKLRREAACKLRQAGISIPKIAKELRVTAGTVSIWVQNIPITDEQKSILHNNTRNGTMLKAQRMRASVPRCQKKERYFTHPKEIGDASAIRVAAAFVEAGLSISIPWGENCRYDMVVENTAGKLLKVQAKTALLIEDGGALSFPTVSLNYRKDVKGHTRNYKGEVDLFGVYSPDTGKVYVIGVDSVPDTMCTLRLTPPLNGQKKRLRWAKEYEFTGNLPL